jgi:uncharacterized protein YjbI with pentapeptide repeats
MGRHIEDVTIPIETTNGEKKKCRSFIDWAKLLISLSIPLAIVVYTIIENQNESSIAAQNRKQDFEIEERRREQDIRLANESRYQEASEQQQEATLVRYFDSLGKLLEKNGMYLNKTETGRAIAQFKTLTALSQLNSKRKSFLMRFLIQYELLTVKGNELIIALDSADLVGLDLTDNMLEDNKMECVYLSSTTLTNANFRNMIISGSAFKYARLGNADFSSSYDNSQSCGTSESVGASFDIATLNGSNFNNGHYRKSVFNGASLIRVQMRNFTCMECDFTSSNLDFADMSYAKFGPYGGSHSTDPSQQQVSDFKSANATSGLLLYQATFDQAHFGKAKLIGVNATRASFSNCIFDFAELPNSFFVESAIANSSFLRANLTKTSWKMAKVRNTSFIQATMRHVDFTDGECDHCLFNMADLTGADFTNTSLTQSDFTDANITYAQLALAQSLQGVTLPNGTILA